ncbi:MAG: selenocysteine-specific translation elongation factor [Desulfomonile tiedjei]|uniref:Selenocysteine-specific elongation factor n=1 Tax=Desulfomonile tiedjei TaxID=2358 RepID=A0A9D6UZF1_9BACT|nr:selenocysteine-specific translation elongation factor [Desulfomonile tiedjei]
MKRVILGTAGHIDHGKTELVRALTGIDTDRLKEEKQRGISIELGFAFLDLGDDIRMGIVDVPGHEKFVRHMVAGSGGIDIAALVIALDEGVMPQTVEHLDILSLLSVRMGLVVLTKSDLVDEELAMLAEEDAKDAVKGTFLEEAPFIRVSSKTGDGIDQLRTTLKGLALLVTERPVHGLLRLPVDRVFTIKGHGTVVTGTLISGTLSTGDEVEILPSGMKTTVRSLESHNRSEEKAFPGERVAVNLRGLEQGDIQRGEVLTHPGQFKPSYIVDVKLRALDRSPIPLNNRRKVRLHHYTSDVEARVILPDMDVLEPGKDVIAQLRAAAPIVPATGDRFVIRALSPSITLGGGVVMNPRAVKLRARSAKFFMELDRSDDAAILESLVRSSGMAGIGKNELLGLSGFSAKRLEKVLETIKNSRLVIRFDAAEHRMVHSDFFEIVRNKLLEKLKTFHAEQPLKEGISKQELRSAVPGTDKLVRSVMESLAAKGEISDQGNLVRLASHKVKLKDEEKDIKNKLSKMIVQGGNAPPVFKEIVAAGGVDSKQTRNLLGILERERIIVRISEELYFSNDFIEDVKGKLVEFIKREGGLTPSQFHEITRSSRKYNIPLLEYFDRQRFTMRIGDQRVLRGSGSSGEGGKVE